MLTEEGHEITCEMENFFAVRDALEGRFGEPQPAKLDWRPEYSISLAEEKARTVLQPSDALVDNDDIQAVYAYFDLPYVGVPSLAA